MTAHRHSGSDDRQRVLDATEIVQIVGECVNLRPKGREFVGLCPFHDDHSPSMYVAPAKQIFKCFSCGAGGNAIDFFMRFHRMEFREALQALAERGGIELTSWRRDNGDGDDGDEPRVSGAQLIDAHRTALGFYRAILRHANHGAVARKVFESRGISEAMIERFELGAAPDRWDGLAQTLQSKSTPLEPFTAAGLIQHRKTGSGHVDRFRNRLIFPIHDMTGRPIAFGARKIDPDDEPKYLNSPEHARFHKSRTLYGLHLAKTAIQRRDTAILVEGYTDVIACHQVGVENVVATLGTSLTPQHASMLRRLCNRVVLVFDGDVAGQKAADRAVEIFFQSDVDVRIAVLPGGQDPADFVAGDDGAARFNAAIDAASDALDFLLAALRRELESAEGGISSQQRVVESFADRLGRLGFHQMGPLRRDLVLSKLNELLGVAPTTLLQLIPKARSKPAPAPSSPAPSTRSSSTPESATHSDRPPAPHIPAARRDAEQGLAGCLLHTPQLLTHLDSAGRPLEETLRPEMFADRDLRHIVECLLEAPDDQRELNRLSVLNESEHLSRLATDVFWRIRRESGDELERVRELLTAYLDSVREWGHADSERRSEMTETKGDASTVVESRDPIERLEALVRQAREKGGNRRRLARPHDPNRNQTTSTTPDALPNSGTGNDSNPNAQVEGVPTRA